MNWFEKFIGVEININEVLVNYDRYLVMINKKNLFNKPNSFKYIAVFSGLVSFSLFCSSKSNIYFSFNFI